jgi:hypothetical protein
VSRARELLPKQPGTSGPDNLTADLLGRVKSLTADSITVILTAGLPPTHAGWCGQDGTEEFR